MNLSFIILLFLFEALLSTIFLIVMFEDVESIFRLLGLPGENRSPIFRQVIAQLLGFSKEDENNKYSVLRVLGFSMGGLLLALQALIANRRAKAMQDTAKTQVEANKHTEQGQRQERLKNAIEHLGNDSASIRLGGTYELFHLAGDTKEWRQTVLDIFCAHIRTKTGEKSYQQEYPRKPSVEIQSMLNLLFREDHDVFGKLHVDLKESWLKGVDLGEAFLSRAILTGVHLQEADLWGARLQGADLQKAWLQGANLQEARLQGADLQEARLQGADLQKAQLQGANLQEAQLQGANLREAQLQGAILPGAQLQGAVLQNAQLQGVRPDYVQEAASESTPSPRGLFEDRMNSGICAATDLSDVIFGGGLKQGDMDELLKDLSSEKAEELRKKLQPHIDQRTDCQPPAESGAVCGTYTKRQAKQWVAEYEEAESQAGFWRGMGYIRARLRRS